MTTIRVRLFAHMAQQAGIHDFKLSIPAGTTVAQNRPLVEQKFPTVRWPQTIMLAVNQQYVPPDHPLHENDEVAIIPPVSGG